MSMKRSPSFPVSWLLADPMALTFDVPITRSVNGDTSPSGHRPSNGSCFSHMPTEARITCVSSARGRPHQQKPMPTKNLENSVDELRPEYDLGSLTGGVRGKYYARATAGTTLVLLEPDVAEGFPDGPSVNKALRSYLRIERAKLANKRLQPSAARRSSKKRSRRRG